MPGGLQRSVLQVTSASFASAAGDTLANVSQVSLCQWRGNGAGLLEREKLPARSPGGGERRSPPSSCSASTARLKASVKACRVTQGSLENSHRCFRFEKQEEAINS